MCSWATVSPWCCKGRPRQLTTVPNQFNASQLEISTSTANGNVISGNITSGDLGGLLAARTQVINPALNQLGQIATAFSQTVNSQQGDGLDLSGNLGANIFSVGSAVGHVVLEKHGRRHRQRQRQRQRFGCADRGQLHLIVPGRHADADRYHHGRQRDADGRRHGRQSLHREWRFHRPVGRSRGRRSVPDSAHGDCGLEHQRRADRSFANRGGRRNRRPPPPAPIPARPPSVRARC